MVRACIEQSRNIEQKLNLLAVAPVWLLAILVVALIAAAVEDAARLKISNITILVVLGSAVAAILIQGPTLSMWQNAAVFCLLLGLGTAAFTSGLLGGGDVKLLAATALWVDFRTCVWLIALVFFSGGLLALLYLASRLFCSRKSNRIPYGIAIALGAFAVISVSRGLLQPHPRPLPPIKIVRPAV